MTKVKQLFLLFLIITFSVNYGQSKSISNIDSSTTTNSINSTQVEEGDVDFTDGTNSLIRITDEGTFGSIEIKPGVPSTTLYKLYNDGGTLKFNGSSLVGGTGASKIDELSDAQHDSIGLYIGIGAGMNDDGMGDGTPNYNIGIGMDALNQNTVGVFNTAIGYESLNLNEGIQNIVIGHQNSKSSLLANYNTIIGTRANYYNESGDRNTIIGLRAGFGSLGNSYSGSIFIGYEAGFSEITDNKLYIENSSSTSPLIWGDFATDSIKINGGLEVSSKTKTPFLQITNGANNGFILTSDAVGNASWQASSSSGAVDINGLNDAKYDGSSVFLGNGAGSVDDGGNQNSALGKDALGSNTSGSGNVASGYQALKNNTTGQMNSSLGIFALTNNSTGSANTAIGNLSLYTNSTADSNTAAGWQALRANSTGTSNTATGAAALWKNTTGNYNSSFGQNSLFSNTSGSNNTAIGYNSLKHSTGNGNTSLGSGSLFTNSTGGGNVSVGINSLYKNSTGSLNISLGQGSQYYNTSGENNVGIGYRANLNNTTGSNNTIIGHEAGGGGGSHAKEGNVFLGHMAGFAETGNNKLYIDNSNTSSPLIWGDFNSDILSFNGKVGINTSSPTAGLHITNDDGVLFEGVFGTGTIPKEGIGNRMMWFPKKAAFRVGAIVNPTNAWDEINIGDYSYASGLNTKASGYGATALGNSTEAAGSFSIAMGSSTNATGGTSTAMGSQTNALGTSSTAMGHSSDAVGSYSIAMGFDAVAGHAATGSGNYAIAIGHNTTAYGDYSTVMGSNTSALASYTTAIGYNTTAGLSFEQGGDYATAFGHSTTATGNSSTSMGKTTTASGDYSFAIGLSASSEGQSAISMGQGTEASGNYSVAMGNNTIASGGSSTSIGTNTIASDVSSTAMGSSTTASGVVSTAMGSNTTASGDYSTAAGYFTTASGDRSTALGSNVTTNGHHGSFVIGDYSTSSIMSQQKDNEMKMRFANGYFLYSSSSLSTGVYMLGGTSGWNNISDRNKKENFSEIDGETLLNKIKALPVTKWNYKNTDPRIKYVGPMAQDFFNTFHLGGTDSLGINSIAIDGINLAGVKALEERTRVQEKRITELENQNLELRLQNTQFKNQITEARIMSEAIEKRLYNLEAKINNKRFVISER